MPQGSNLGPFLFSIYTQELSSVLTCECQHTNNSQETTTGLFDYECDICRILITFTDDLTIILKAMKHNSDEVSLILDEILVMLEEFLGSNNLQLNIDKTQLLRITTRQQIVANKGEKICLQALDSDGNNNRPKESAKVLGLTVNSNLNWIGHLSKGKDSIISKCKAKIGALKFSAKNSSLMTKNNLQML